MANNNKDAQVYVDRGKNKHKSKNFRGAIEDYSKAIELDPQNEVAFFESGITKGTLEDFQGAIEDFSKAIEKNPSLTGDMQKMLYKIIKVLLRIIQKQLN